MRGAYVAHQEELRNPESWPYKIPCDILLGKRLGPLEKYTSLKIKYGRPQQMKICLLSTHLGFPIIILFSFCPEIFRCGETVKKSLSKKKP